MGLGFGMGLWSGLWLGLGLEFGLGVNYMKARVGVVSGIRVRVGCRVSVF